MYNGFRLCRSDAVDRIEFETNESEYVRVLEVRNDTPSCSLVALQSRFYVNPRMHTDRNCVPIGFTSGDTRYQS